MWASIVKLSVGKDTSSKESLMSTNSEESKTLNETITNYLETFDEQDKGQDKSKIEERQNQYETLVKSYYNLVTDFYEYGWGESFHFAPRYSTETFKESVARHEYYLALRLGIKPGDKVLDCGCGVGGPMRAIARFTQANITGVTICPYQVSRANHLNEKYGLAKLCNAVQGDFMQLPFQEQFDFCYAVEATCHAPNRTKCFQEMYKALKPGGTVAVYDWAMTPLYDPTNAYHRLIKHEIEKGDALPDLKMQEEIVQSFRDAGFQVLEHGDLAVDYEARQNTIPWHATIQGGWSLSNWKHSKLGRMLTQFFVALLEFLHIAPKGTSDTHRMLCHAADYLAIGGNLKIFTPMFFVLARKPA